MAVVVAFFICWAPFHVQRLIAIYGTNSEDHVSSKGPLEEFLYLLFTYLSGVLYYVSTTINPILYNIMSNKFRQAFMVSFSIFFPQNGTRKLDFFRENWKRDKDVSSPGDNKNPVIEVPWLLSCPKNKKKHETVIETFWRRLKTSNVTVSSR